MTVEIPSEIEHVIENGDRSRTVQIAHDAYPFHVRNAIIERLVAEGFSVAVTYVR